ncbi:uncharacterized protein LOC118842510 [Trichosurus vulpecula]|uniref:uncharacterized protein LOC118842510 n=1 Tax=Trichosurus vulpecula TaxID=9337 RepID=UPI00186B03D1|nr:uncharacterized protein LOC118842510 [Trichosurus vulpecula]
MPFFMRSVWKILSCCRLTFQVEETFLSQSVNPRSLTDERKPDSEATSLSEDTPEPKTSSVCTVKPEEEKRNTAIDSPGLLPDYSNVPTPSDVGESRPLFPMTRSSLNAPLQQQLETDSATEQDLRQDLLQATSNPTSSLSKGTGTLAKKMTMSLQAPVAEGQWEGEVPVRPLEEMEEEDEENTMLPEKQSHSTEDIAGFSDIVAIGDPPSQTQEVSEAAPDHQQGIPEQSDPDNLTRSLAIFHDHDYLGPLVTRSR